MVLPATGGFGSLRSVGTLQERADSLGSSSRWGTYLISNSITWLLSLLVACVGDWFLDPFDARCLLPAANLRRYPSLIKLSTTPEGQVVVDNAFVVKATLETRGDAVVVEPR